MSRKLGRDQVHPDRRFGDGGDVVAVAGTVAAARSKSSFQAADVEGKVQPLADQVDDYDNAQQYDAARSLRGGFLASHDFPSLDYNSQATKINESYHSSELF